MRILRRLFDHPWQRYLSAFVIGTVLALLSLVQRGFALRIYYRDALTTAGALLILFGLLLMVSNLGAFDIFSYALSNFRAELSHRSLYDYREAKAVERRGHTWSFMPFVSVGLLFLAVGLLLGIGLYTPI